MLWRILYFQKNNFDFIQDKIKGPKEFLIVYTQRPKKTTAELVESIKNLETKYRDYRIKKIGNCSKEIYEALKNYDLKKLYENINLCQDYLRELKVSTPEIDKICELVKKNNGAAKLSGAGGGGAVICHHKNLDEIQKIIESDGYKTDKISIGVEGVRAEN